MTSVEGYMKIVAHQTERTGDLLEQDFKWKRDRRERLDATRNLRNMNHDDKRFKLAAEAWKTVKVPVLMVLTAIATMLIGAGSENNADLSVPQLEPPYNYSQELSQEDLTILSESSYINLELKE